MTCFGRINPSFALLRYYANSPTKQLHGAEFFESYFALSLNSQRNAAELSADDKVTLKFSDGEAQAVILESDKENG